MVGPISQCSPSAKLNFAVPDPAEIPAEGGAENNSFNEVGALSLVAVEGVEDESMSADVPSQPRIPGNKVLRLDMRGHQDRSAGFSRGTHTTIVSLLDTSPIHSSHNRPFRPSPAYQGIPG